MSEAMGQCYPAREAFDSLREAFFLAFECESNSDRFAGLENEFQRIMAWAAAQADLVLDSASWVRSGHFRPQFDLSVSPIVRDLTCDSHEIRCGTPRVVR